MKENFESSVESKESLNNYTFETLDPRINHPNEKIKEQANLANQAIFDKGNIMGIEVTIPGLAEKCDLGNIDPQHSENNENLAAIEVAETIELPEGEVTFATIRADLDSVGSMAIISLRQEGVEITDEIRERVSKIADADKFNNGPWPGKKTLPSLESPWGDDNEELGAIAASTADFKLSMQDRVEMMKQWIQTGKESEQYRMQVKKEREEIVNALESGEIKVETVADGRIALIESKHRAGMQIGYSQAPIVVALNPEFGFGDAPKVKKYTIAQFENGFVDLKEVKEDLEKLEPGWGGSPTIIGSPQGESSKLSKEEVIRVVERHTAPDVGIKFEAKV